MHIHFLVGDLLKSPKDVNKDDLKSPKSDSITSLMSRKITSFGKI